jgi:uncharacterized membrane protein YdjX (TVP38/TMEM64 family)
LFGLWWGTAAVSVASTATAALAFLIARYLARAAVERKAAANPRFAALDRAIGEGGWRIIALLRLSPAVPFSLGNYLFGLTSIRFWPYVLSSWIAMLPGTFLYVYLGWVGGQGLSAVAGDEASRPLGQWILLGVGLLATVVVSVYVTRLARRAIAGQTQIDEAGDGSTPGPEAADDSAAGWTPATFAALALAALVLGATAYAYLAPESFSTLVGGS